jgi:hypothetical protein
MDNGTAPNAPRLSESDEAAMDVFLSHMLGILPVLGVDAFEQSSAQVSSPSNPMLYSESSKAKATGKDTPQGFIVLEGSLASVKETPSLLKHKPSYCKLRQKLVDNGVLAADGTHYRFTQDYTFRSPSEAAVVVLGRSANGLTEWKTSTGETLKQLQEAQATDE